ncbi:MAG: phosphate ABC transporter substrate-binding protein [Candidatus Omnitrophota bacterium]
MKNNYFVNFLLIVLFLAVNIETTRAEDIKIAGSESMVKIVEILAANYLATHPEIKIDVKGGTTDVGISQLNQGTITIANASTRIDVKGGTTEEAISQLKQGTITIANASSQMQASDIRALMESDRRYIELVLAHDNLCVVVNEANPIKTLTMEQVRQIYTGEIKNWKQVGGDDCPIVLLGRELTSAQALFFQQKLNIAAYDESMRQLTDASETEKLKSDVSAIGFVGLAYAKDPSIAAVNLAFKTGFTPLNPFDQEVIKKGIYPLKRKLFQYITTDNLTPAVKEFLKFEFSESGQAILSKNNVCPAPKNEIKENLLKLNTL